jgi:nitroimidazol reductase NimA-like FMN-containing flavoprotein (pyridoxamine 5'-phosphate oxidase superfamily)
MPVRSAGDQDLGVTGALMSTTIPAARRMRELAVDESIALLVTRPVGRLVYVAEGKPKVVPLNYMLHRRAITFRTGYGGLLDHIEHADVLFEVDYSDNARRVGWSVIVHGVAEEIWRSDELDIMRELPLRPWAPGDRDHYVRIAATQITGRMII